MPMIFSRGRRALAVLIALGGLAGAGPALARCSIDVTGFVPQDVQMDMGQVVILPYLPVGGLIKELIVPINTRAFIATCDSQGGTAYGRFVNAMQQTLVPGFNDVYATDVEGVGIRVYRDSGGIQTYYPHTLAVSQSLLSIVGGRFRVELIKTAAQTGSGTIAPSGRFTTYYLDGDGAGTPLLTSTFKGFGTTVVSPTCAVQAGSRNIAVDFGSVPNTTFTGIGSRAVDRDFDIRLDCQGSNVAEYQSRIGIRLDADQDSSNMPGVLKLSAAADSATRIGIQLVQRDGSSEREVRFGQAISIGTTTSGGATMTLPLRARYVQTEAGTVGAGVANGQATFTIEYD